MSDTELPPFGIRGLCSPDEPFSVLQISESQYDASVKSYPEAALTWLDDDDGETVTVGTGWELRERLRDPIPAANPRIQYRSADTQRAEDRYIHLFDISKSQTSLNVWREYEAHMYFSKAQIPPPVKTHKKAKSTATEKCQHVEDIQSSLCDINQTSEISLKENKELVPIAEPSLQTTMPELVEGLGFGLDHLAGFLQGTSDTLRRAAEKTRTTNTSPIEDVLTGMTTILGEVGAFGLDVIEKLNEPRSDPLDYPMVPGKASTITTSVVSDLSHIYGFGSKDTLPGDQLPSPISESALPVQQTAVQDELRQRMKALENVNNDSFLIAKEARVKLLNDELHLLHKLISLNRRDLLQTKDRKSSVDAGRAHQTAELGRAVEREQFFKDMAGIRAELDRFDLITMRPLSNQPRDAKHCPGPKTISTSQPILDQDADAIDAAFSARYPPLLSLRKAKTFDVLRVKQTDDEEDDENIFSLTGGPFLYRTIHRPSPQVFDAETQRRKEFAKTCFPSQEYTPGPGTTNLKIRRPKDNICIETIEVSEAPDAMPSKASPRCLSAAEIFKNLSAEHSAKADPFIGHTTGKIVTSEETSMAKLAATTLPGAWPVLNTDTTVPMLAQQEEKTGDLNYTTKVVEPRLEIPSPMPQVAPRRLHRHRSLINPETRSKPLPNLGRSHTVKHISPAARLSGPFNPLFPSPTISQDIGTPKAPEAQANIEKQSAGPIRNLHRSNSDRRPRSLYEPYRMHGNHRTFEPVWEDHLQHQKAVVPNPGAVIVDASNFEKGTTDKDIRDMLADDCRAENGINTLISCRIIQTEPTVVAKLVIKDKYHADQIINKYDQKWVQGWPIHVEYAQTGIDARINRIRGALSSTEAYAPRHLRSVPNLHDVARREIPMPASPKTFIGPQPAISKHTDRRSDHWSDRPVVPSPVMLTPGFAPAVQARIESCERQLKAMGYGLTDPALLSRLHVYAAAANGDVDAAIDMIDEDKKASAIDDVEKAIEQSREENLRGPMAGDFGQSEDFALELERALRNSMEEK